ncbi:MAG: hypothetical protein JSU72_06730 [Deltaproteobacteria bacterium]|nr:MAG: hypothetical protein JSU72_06730 [Deltaproteobacteria bacterium]
MIFRGVHVKKIFLLLIAMVGFGIVPPVQAFEIGVRGYYWFPGLDGNIRVDANGITGTKIDLKSDLGLSDESYPVIEGFVGLGKHHLSVSYYRADYSGNNILSRDIVFNGITFPANTQVGSSLKYDVFDAMYWYDLLNLKNILAGFSLGLVGRVEVFDGSVEINSLTLGAREEFTLPVPLLGINLDLGILADLLGARLLATGIGYSKGSMIDAQADIYLSPLPLLDIRGGYRLFLVDLETNDVQFNYDTSGPYVALTLSF